MKKKSVLINKEYFCITCSPSDVLNTDLQSLLFYGVKYFIKVTILELSCYYSNMIIFIFYDYVSLKVNEYLLILKINLY